MSKIAELERQIAAMKKAENSIKDRTAGLMTLPDGEKKKLWDELCPFIKTAVDGKLKGADIDFNELKNILCKHALKVVLGEENVKSLELF